MNRIVSSEHQETSQQMRSLLATYENNAELIQIGAYKRGSDRSIDQAIQFHPKIQAFLKQGVYEYHTLQESIEKMHLLLQGGHN
ncbi:hypothetical protein [Lentibacillus sp. JNUCC-1]|uniref:hypothetical protein n=1 Tax=Lentibacillus sp. JNUCC-1 TaxID=2654513 RepID=UPI003FA588F0